MSAPSARSLQVEVGGTAGYADLDVAANFSDGLSTGREDVYTHGNGVIAEGVGGIDAKVGAAWASAGPGTAEFGVYAPGFFAASYKDIWVGNGLPVAEADVDVDNTSPTFLKDFERFVSEGRTVGHVQNFAPIFSPNSTSQYNGSQASLGSGFFDAKWASVRAAAIYGGGIAFDTPPQFAFWSPPWYLNFVEQEIRWGESMGLRTSVIVSPYHDPTTFLADSEKFEQMLVSAHAAPTQWVIENYGENANGTYPNDSDDPNAIGSERTPETVAAVADWFARNAPVAVLGANGGSWRIQNADGSYGDTYAGSVDGRTLVDASAVAKTLYTYNAGGAQTASAVTLTPPVVAHATTVQSATGGVAVHFSVAPGAFVDPSGEALTLSARLSSLAKLPAWLSFDAATGAFAGTPPNAAAVLSLRVDATAPDGRSADEVFALDVAPSRLPPAAPIFAGSGAPAASVSLAESRPFSLTVDQEPVAAHVLRIAREASFAPLPSWVGFDASTATLSGVAPATPGSLAVRIDEAPPTGGMTVRMFNLSW